MSDAPWLEVAKSLPCGQHVKIMCCSSSPSMLVSHDQSGYHGHCFKCKAHPVEKHGIRSIAEINRHRTEYEAHSAKTPFLPKDFTQDIPTQAMWFLKYGISAEHANRCGLGYSDYFERVVMPVYNLEGELTAVTMRAWQLDHKPKYLNIAAPMPSALWYSELCRYDIDTVVITEDIISAMKVALVHPSISTLGAHVSDQQAYIIAQRFKRVVIWYDDDKAGRLGAIDAERQLYLAGVPETHRIRSTGKDPKENSRDEIRSFLEKVLI